MTDTRRRGKSLCVCTALFSAMILAVVGTAVQAQARYSVLYDFTGAPSTGEAVGLLAQGADGNLYGVSYYGGVYNNGTIYQMSLAGGPPNVLYSFSTYDECNMGLTLGTDGNFYGSCAKGGAYNLGYAFQMTPPPNVTFNVLYNFSGYPDGAQPTSRPIEAADGNFYMTTFTGGDNDLGAAFQITPTGTNKLYSFSAGNVSYPNGPLLLGSNGNLYGTTQAGKGFPPPPACGAIYEITTAGQITVLHTFAGGTSDGATPTRGVLQGSDGNFYGTTIQGGKRGLGTVFRMTPAGQVKLLHSFTTAGYGYPRGLTLASNGNFYGVANDCETGCKDTGDGSIFEISPTGKFLIIHKFEGPDGTHPDSALSNTNGDLYGVTLKGGTHNESVLYRLSFAAPEYCRPQIALGQQNSLTQILGQGFDSSSVVAFDGVPTPTVVVTGSTFITATVPPEAQTGFVTVITGSKTLKSLQPFQVLPTIGGFTPPNGPVGTHVTIKGTGLTQTTKVSFGSVNAKFAVDSDIQVTAIVPKGAATAPIYITTKGGTTASLSEFTVN